MFIKTTTSDKEIPREIENRKLAYRVALEGMVLLENDGTLPLEKGNLALYGSGADYTIASGSGSGEVNPRHTVSVREGLENSGFTVTTKAWLKDYDETWKKSKEEYIKESRRMLRPSARMITALMSMEFIYPVGRTISDEDVADSQTDACLYVISRQSGEGRDRKDEEGSFRFKPEELVHIRFCAARYARFILAINTGCIIDLTPLKEIEGINAVIYMGQAGMEGGNALADLISGKATPSGKLAVTWANKYEDYPFHDEFGAYAKEPLKAPYKEGLYVGYRYFDSFGKSVRYPFGYGLSYTTFAVKTEKAELVNKNIRLTVRVENTGKQAGKEIVQVYASLPQNKLDVEYQRLIGFAKSRNLQPKESETLVLNIPLETLSIYDEAWALTLIKKGAHLIRVGVSSRKTEEVAVIYVKNEVILSRHHNLCASSSHVAVLKSEKKNNVNGSLPVLTVEPSVFETVTYDYKEKEPEVSEEVRKLMKGFTEADMVRFCAGTGLFSKNKGFQTPGAVGHLTADYLDRGIPNVEMCDGPAGLRVQRRSTIDKKGKIKAVDNAISIYEILPDFITRFLLGNPDKDPVHYQFVTGFPVAALIAQSWNLPLAEEIGQAVSREMSEYGVTYWLAPALNIVRNPLCGRNFEYYSEDPLISGKMAAAVTKGVQATEGNYVTVKHFAANNQETERNFVTSDVDERVLREIYLKGFEIAVREAQPKAVMSAYNKINGVYCPNNRDLLTDILRGEWDFKGIVMTDWLATGKKRAKEEGCINSGNDLIMPGGNGVVKTLLKRCKEGTLDKKKLATSCARVLQQIMNSQNARILKENKK